MMLRFLITLYILSAAATLILAYPEGIVSVAVTTILSGAVLLLINRFGGDQRDYLIKVFGAALVARCAVGLIIHVYDLRGFFGGDANTYDALAGKLADIWTGVADERILDAVDQGRLHDFLGMGMYYWIAALYTLIGRNILAAQSVCGVIGAATAPLLYSCAVKVFVNRNVGRIAAALVALFPAMVIWSSQLLKDGLIVFFFGAGNDCDTEAAE